MKLSEWAKQEGIHYQTAWKWFRDGKLPVPAVRTPSGTILVEVPRAGLGEMHGRSSTPACLLTTSAQTSIVRLPA